MKIVLFIISGIIGGVIGGMGMGGGTLLIPILTIFFAVAQRTAQAINLISFIPMAIIALIVHAKNKLIKFDYVFLIIIFGTLSCVGGCLIAKIISENLLKRFFGAFLLFLSFFQFFEGIKQFNNN